MFQTLGISLHGRSIISFVEFFYSINFGTLQSNENRNGDSSIVLNCLLGTEAFNLNATVPDGYFAGCSLAYVFTCAVADGDAFALSNLDKLMMNPDIDWNQAPDNRHLTSNPFQACASPLNKLMEAATKHPIILNYLPRFLERQDLNWGSHDLDMASIRRTAFIYLMIAIAKNPTEGLALLPNVLQLKNINWYDEFGGPSVITAFYCLLKIVANNPNQFEHLISVCNTLNNENTTLFTSEVRLSIGNLYDNEILTLSRIAWEHHETHGETESFELIKLLADICLKRNITAPTSQLLSYYERKRDLRQATILSRAIANSMSLRLYQQLGSNLSAIHALDQPLMHSVTSDLTTVRTKNKQHNAERRKAILNAFDIALSIRDPNDSNVGHAQRREMAVLFIYGKTAKQELDYKHRHKELGDINAAPETARQILLDKRQLRKQQKTQSKYP